jgi:hypothetical protein
MHETASLWKWPSRDSWLDRSRPPGIGARYSQGKCERGDLNPHALRHWILSPARLPFRHSRVRIKVLKFKSFLKVMVVNLDSKLHDFD